MMLGDISAEPYKTTTAIQLRTKLLEPAKARLKERNYLEHLGTTRVIIPFPGARGIKFVLEGNNKERGTRDLINYHRIKPKHILFVGNELFKGGNDNMMRNIPRLTLLSVGEKTDPGEWVIEGSIDGI